MYPHRFVAVVELFDQHTGGMEQFTCASDPDLNGAVLEKILTPDGSDRLPYHLRDLGTIFFIQAAAKLIRCR